MVGSGPVMFAVWGYVIAKMQPDKEVGAQVDLNPKLLAFTLGTEESEVESVITKLCSPDPNSRSKDEDGRRLVQVGTFSYRVVNGARYAEMRSEEARREYNRVRQRTLRAKKPKLEEIARGQLVDGKNMENPNWRTP